LLKLTKSKELFARAREVLPGGVNSPVRSFSAVGGDPRFIARASGSKVYDVDGNEYIDYLGSWGPLILGHAHPWVSEAVKAAVERGTSYGAPTEAEVEIAYAVVNAVPSIEKVRFVSSGTEATMSALRVARGYTGRNKVIKFIGCYHGHADSFLVKAGSGAMTLGVPNSPGVPPGTVEDTITLPFNDLEAVKEAFAKFPDQIAAVILEPIAGNMGVIPPVPGFLEGLREITKQEGAVLIFDEVITGFRVAYGGAQALYGITPDMTCLGKIIGGGMPVGAYGGRAEIMDQVAPVGPVYQAGTLSGNPVAMVAGLETLKLLAKEGVYEGLDSLAAELTDGMREAAEEFGLPVCINRVGSMFTLFFTDREVRDYEGAASADVDMYKRYFHGLLERGVYVAPSQFEAGFLSLAHTREDVERTLEAVREVFKTLA